MSYDQRVRDVVRQRERLSALLQDQRQLDVGIQDAADTVQTLRRRLEAEERIGRSRARAEHRERLRQDIARAETNLHDLRGRRRRLRRSIRSQSQSLLEKLVYFEDLLEIDRTTRFPREITVMIADIRYYERLAEEDVDL